MGLLLVPSTTILALLRNADCGDGTLARNGGGENGVSSAASSVVFLASCWAYGVSSHWQERHWFVSKYWQCTASFAADVNRRYKRVIEALQENLCILWLEFETAEFNLAWEVGGQRMDDSRYEDAIVRSWHKNVDAWTSAVRGAEISSRVTVTDAAIVNAVVAQAPKSVLDLGCGEGWLVRALAGLGIAATGVDVVPALISKASVRGGDFRVLSYQGFAAGRWPLKVDCVVCNFSLLGKDIVGNVLRAMPAVLTEQGHCIIQTLHPAYAGEPYCDGWREGSWTGFSSDFTEPAPWYFRTLSSWQQLFSDCGLQLKEMLEPLNNETGKPASVIFVVAAAKD